MVPMIHLRSTHIQINRGGTKAAFCMVFRCTPEAAATWNKGGGGREDLKNDGVCLVFFLTRRWSKKVGGVAEVPWNHRAEV